MSRVFLFNIAPEKAARIRLAALRLGLEIIEVAPEDFGKPLGLLLGEEYYLPGGSESFTEEMLIMEELSSPLLDALRQLGAPVALKAVVTESNKGWSAAALCRELRKEHEAMKAYAPRKPVHTHKKRH